MLSRVQLFCDSMGFSLLGSSVHGISRQDHWIELPFSPPGDLPNPGIKPASLASPTFAEGFFTPGATWQAYVVGGQII